MTKGREDPVMDSVLRRALQDRPEQRASPCPDENGLAAYLENRLERSERLAFEGHVSDCARCREVLALSLRMGSPGEAERAVPADVPQPKRLLFKFSLPLSSFALLVVAAIALWAVYQTYQERAGRPTGEMAQLKAPASDLVPAEGPSQQLPSAEAPRIPDVTTHGRNEAAGPPASPRISAAVTADRSNERVKDEIELRLPAKEINSLDKAGAAGKDSRAQGSEPGLAPVGKTATREVARIDRMTAETEKKDANLSVSQAEEARFAAVAPAQPAPAPEGLKAREILRLFAREFGSYRESDAAGREGAPGERKAGATQTVRVAPAPENARAIGSKRFVSFSGYWIDSECAGHPDEEPVELTEGDERLIGIRGDFPEIGQILGSGQPVLLRWRGGLYRIP